MSSGRFSRRRFLQNSGTAAALWIPTHVNGYTQQELVSFSDEERIQREINLHSALFISLSDKLIDLATVTPSFVIIGC